MKISTTATLLLLACQTALGNDWGPLIQPSDKITLAEIQCAEGKNKYRSLQRFVFRNDHEDARFVFAPGIEKWRLSLKINNQQYLSHVYSDQNLSMGVIAVYAKDLNNDHLTDYVVELENGGFCGLNAGHTQILLILPQNEGNPIIQSFWTYGTIKDTFVDLDHNGSAEVIVTDLYSLASKHNYWVHDRYELNGTALVPARTNVWPVWVWFTETENHKNTSHFTRAEKDAMWTEWLNDRISPVIETAVLRCW